MSWPERLVRDHKRQTDCAIHRVYAQLASDPLVREKFDETLFCARERAARLFEAPLTNGRHPGVDALLHLSRFKAAHIRPLNEWAGTISSWRCAIASLAHHLVGEYKVPMFLAASWYAADRTGDKRRGWFIAHSRGACFRSLNLPMVMTRKMEHVFLASPDGLPVERAMRRAELIALGASDEIVRAVLSTRLATELENGTFWRSVWLFLIEHADEFDPEQVGPLIDYIQAVRHDRVMVQTQYGMVALDPPQPAFSMKGRTTRSLLRLMQDWHRSLGGGISGFSWNRSSFDSLLVEEPFCDDSETAKRWHMIELTNSSQLRNEGAALRHCVASYVDRCCRGYSSIWSLRLVQGQKIRHVMTVEVDPRKRAVIQARGWANRAASGKPLRLLQVWAARERLKMIV